MAAIPMSPAVSGCPAYNMHATTARNAVSRARWVRRISKIAAAKTQPAQAITHAERHPTIRTRAAELEHRGAVRSEGTEPEHPPEHVDAGSGDGVGDEHLDGVGQMKREEIADEDGTLKAADCQLKASGMPRAL